MSTVFVDRESAYPNRYRVIPESGNPYYIILERDDEPVTPGTPLNAETFNGMRDEIDAALASKAPAGFGYGEYRSISHWNDEDGTQLEANLDSFFNSVDKLDKVYRFKLVDYPACEASGQGGFADIMCSDMSDGTPRDITIVYYALMGGVTIATKKKHAGVWYPWEYVNPTMQLGVEYRTTERYMGKPVYYKLFDFGFMPNATLKQIAHGLNEASYIAVDSSRSIIYLDNSRGGSLLPINENIQYLNLSDGCISIKCSVDLSEYHAYIFLKYTKITD